MAKTAAPTDAQAAALRLMREKPLERGFFDSGWGPWKAGERSHKVEVNEQTANAMIKRGWAIVESTGPKPKDKVLAITEAGAAALDGHGSEPRHRI